MIALASAARKTTGMEMGHSNSDVDRGHPTSLRRERKRSARPSQRRGPAVARIPAFARTGHRLRAVAYNRSASCDDRSRVAYVESPCPLSEPGPLNRSPSVSVGIKSEPIDAPTISVIGS